MPIIADLELQSGQEAASDGWGTAVAPTVILAGIQDVDISPLVDVQRVDQMCGTRAPAYQSLVHMVGGEGSVSGLASYNDAPYWFQGLFGVASATSDLGGGYTRSYEAPFESSDTADAVSYTLVYGDGTNYYGLNGATINSLTLSGESGAPVEFSIDFIGKSVTTDTRAALSCRTVSYIMGDHIDVWIGAGSDALASTWTSDVAWSFELTLEANREVKRYLGDLTPAGYREAKMDGTLSLTMEMNTVTEPYVDAIVSATKEGVEKNVRIYAKDSSSNSLLLDFAGVLSGEPSIFTDVDGIVSVDLELMAKINSGSTNWFAAVISNGNSDLT